MKDISKGLVATAIYARLSLENNGADDEESLETQIAMLELYIKNHPQLQLVDTYADNGFTGTNFDRPAFKRLMNDIKCGRVTCVIVKDLSRFGRNYIETGMYIEDLFPKFGARLIAVNDNFDSINSEDRDSLTLPVKNMINDMYSQDQSRKGILAHKMRMNTPNKLPACKAPYGYRRNEDGSQYIVDPEKGDIVSIIFTWRAMGVSNDEICDRLDMCKIPRPDHKEGEELKPWNRNTIDSITKNPVYLGNLYFGMRRDRLAKGGREKKMMPEDQWVVRRNTHEPLTIPDEFEAAARNRRPIKMKPREKQLDRMGVFRGILYCKNCGRPLCAVVKKNLDLSNSECVIFKCINKRYYDKHCNNYVSETLLRGVVMDIIRHQVKILSDKAQFLKDARSSGDGKDVMASLDKKIASAEKKISDTKAEMIKLYEDYRAGILTEEDYKTLKMQPSATVEAYENMLRTLVSRKNMYERSINSFLGMVRDLKDSHDNGFDDALIRKLIAKIEVTADNKFEIAFRNTDFIEVIDEILKGGSE